MSIRKNIVLTCGVISKELKSRGLGDDRVLSRILIVNHSVHIGKAHLEFLPKLRPMPLLQN
jgi:hypothetical protein